MWLKVIGGDKWSNETMCMLDMYTNLYRKHLVHYKTVTTDKENLQSIQNLISLF